MEDLLTSASAINDLNSALNFHAGLFRGIGHGVTAPFAGPTGKDEFLDCISSLGCGKVRDVVKKGVNVKSTSVSFCLDFAVKAAWSSLCEGLMSRIRCSEEGSRAAPDRRSRSWCLARPPQDRDHHGSHLGRSSSSMSGGFSA